MFSISRRALSVPVVALLAALALAGCGPASSEASAAESSTPGGPTEPRDVSRALETLETEFEAHVGVAAIDTDSGAKIGYRADERFGYASTLKALAAAQLLREVEPDDRDERVTWTAEDVAEAGYSPVTSKHVADGLTLAELAEAAVRESDNTALNLVLERLGGPKGLDRALTRLGDTTTEVVNDEPDLNTIEPGSTDDTTTPTAFTADLGAYLGGSVLDRRDRAVLVDWMSGNATGDTLIRAGAPKGWVVADKSGGADGIRNDLAIVTPPGRDPILITIFTTTDDPNADYDDELVERAAAVVLDALR